MPNPRCLGLDDSRGQFGGSHRFALVRLAADLVRLFHQLLLARPVRDALEGRPKRCGSGGGFFGGSVLDFGLAELEQTCSLLQLGAAADTRAAHLGAVRGQDVGPGVREIN